MALDSYDHFWQVARGLGKNQAVERQRRIRQSAGIRSGYGGASDPLGAQSPMVQNSMFSNLAGMAAGRIDDWESLVDPTLTYDENKAILLENGAQRLPGERERKRREERAAAEDRGRRYARDELLRICDDLDDNVADPPDYMINALVGSAEPEPGVDTDAITETIQDVGDEFGKDFVQDAIERCRERLAMYEREPEPFLERNEAGEVVLDPEEIAAGMIEALKA